METNKNNIIKRDDNAISEVLNSQDKKDLTEHSLALARGKNCSMEVYNRIFEEILPRFANKGELTEKEKNEYLVKASFLLGLDTCAPLWESVSERFGSLAVEFSNELYGEYDCRTASEKALAQTVANAFVRTLEYSNTLETCRSNSVNTNLIGYYSLISKELDRANRQFTTALMALKQIKTPITKVNVKANNAFMANNQQFNQNLSSEKIKPK